MLVIDASALAELLLARPAAASVDRHIIDAGLDLHAPHLLDLEMLNGFRRLVAAGLTTAARCELAVSIMRNMAIRRYAHDALLPRVWALRHNFSAYDAAYVALAEALDAALVTADTRLARAARAHSTAQVLLAA
jgi:predicted nucleic acid-binding protein